ncbi:hypothetical protein LCGC14_1338670 [marine sediment metagenome]|uniref:Uncharacterized protein n=1 Tax=marine sediment metagenome TaxID=412755 RepID=A0A0F9MV92_9ZZZZ
MFSIFGRTENSHFHKEIWNEMTMSIKAANRQTKMVQAQIARIEKKLFTEQESKDFLLRLVKDMVKDTGSW